MEKNIFRNYAAEALKKIGSAAVPALIEALKDRDGYVRRNAAGALGIIGRDAKAAVPALNEALNDKNRDVRESAAWALEEINW
jgi:HEAT repeat protein